MSAHVQEFTAACENAFNGLAIEVDMQHDGVDASTQTSDVAVSRSQNRNASITRIPSQRKEALLASSALSGSPALDHSTDDMIEVPTQAQGVLFQSDTPSEPTLVDTPSGSLFPSVPQQEYGEELNQDEIDLPKVTPFSMETMALVNAALNQIGHKQTYGNSAAIVGLEKKEQEESRGIEPTLEVLSSDDSVPIECNVQNSVENTAAAEASTMEQDDLLRAEQAAHQETRESLSRLDDWCDLVEGENTRFREQIEDTQRENGWIQRQLQDAEDESTGFQTRLAGAEGQIRELVNSTDLYLSTIERLQARVVELNVNVSRYTQLGTSFFVRLQNAEKFMNPGDGLYAEYKHLMGDAARYFSMPASAGDQDCSNGYVPDDMRVEELDESDDSEEHGSSQDSDQENDQKYDQENDQERDEGIHQENDGAYMLGKGKITRHHMPASAVDAVHAEEDITPMDDDDTTHPHRPMRPGTANRVPLSVFAARSGHAAWSPSSSASEDSAHQGQQATEEAASAFTIDYNFSKSAVKSEENFEITAVTEPVQEPAGPIEESEYNAKASNTSDNGRHGRGGVEPGWGHSGRRTTRAKMPLRASRGTLSGNGMKGTNIGDSSSPAPTAFPIDYGFTEHSVNTDNKREGTTRGAFGSQQFESSANPSPAQPKFFGTASEVEQTQASAQEGQTATSRESKPESSAMSIASRNRFSSLGSTLQPSASSPSAPAMEANNSPSSLDLDSGSPQTTPPTHQNKYISSRPAQCIEEQSPSSVSTPRVTEQAGNSADYSLNSVGVELIQSKNTEDGLQEARAGKAKATSNAPDPPKWLKWNWEPFSPKPPKPVPPVWMPISPTIRPFEFENRKGESSKSQRSGAAQEKAHVAKVKSWITFIAPRKTSKKTGRRQNERSVSQEDVRGQEQGTSESSPQTIVQDDGNKEPAKISLYTGSRDQRDEPHQPLGIESAAPNDDGPPTQTEEVYTPPYALTGAFKFENAPPKKRYIPPWSLRYRKS